MPSRQTDVAFTAECIPCCHSCCYTVRHGVAVTNSGASCTLIDCNCANYINAHVLTDVLIAVPFTPACYTLIDGSCAHYILIDCSCAYLFYSLPHVTHSLMTHCYCAHCILIDCTCDHYDSIITCKSIESRLQALIPRCASSVETIIIYNSDLAQ